MKKIYMQPEINVVDIELETSVLGNSPRVAKNGEEDALFDENEEFDWR